ncbi:hypothetical protein [Photobacterium rosenbergii]|uniref:hypothetical protein n=1 Tax=Photobacterium rosenbergii TaxID=294936 RepID=UPI001C99BFEF|nr:hypothetical protein [Photobacterium rosenbergii]MBY5949285.1 hypothetical protein [Photobacterium rosenbergii]
MAVKRTVTTTSCQFQLRLPWALREEIESQLEEGQSLGGWIKEACEMRLGNTKVSKPKPQNKPVPNAANKKRAEETKVKIESVISEMSADEKSELLGERYPKARFSERSGLSKDSVRRYWNEIEVMLKES